MTAYRRVYGFSDPRADCRGLGSALEPYARFEYGTTFTFTFITYVQLKGSVKEPNIFHNYETEKITRKASDAAESIEFSVLPPKIVMQDAFNVIL